MGFLVLFLYWSSMKQIFFESLHASAQSEYPDLSITCLKLLFTIIGFYHFLYVLETILTGGVQVAMVMVENPLEFRDIVCQTNF